jgi:hypothetical protein
MDDAALLRAYLAERDEPCTGCGYVLRGAVGSSCPECAAPIVLGLQHADRPRQMAADRFFRTVLVYFVIRGLLHGFWMIYLLVQFGVGSFAGGVTEFVLGYVSSILIGLMAGVFLVKFRRTSPGVAWLRAAGWAIFISSALDTAVSIDSLLG